MKLKRWIATAMAACTCVSLAACDKKESLPSAEIIVNDKAEHLPENVLHLGFDSIREVGRTFVQNGATEYKLVTGDTQDTDIIKAANYISANVTNATGAFMSWENTPVWSAEAKYIVVGNEKTVGELMSAAGICMTEEKIGSSGYQIKTVGNSVFVMAKGANGFQLGALSFLRIVLGYDMFESNLVIYEKDGTTLPDMDIVERPDYDYRLASNSFIQNDTASLYGMGYTGSPGNVYLAPDGSPYHNSFKYLPPETYLADNPDWYSEHRDGKYHQQQLCYTAHGNAEEKAKMQSIIAARILALAAGSDKTNVTVTQQDIDCICECTTCTDEIAKYGSVSALIIKFVNGVDDLVQAELQRQADENGTEKREMNILFFAYHKSLVPPSVSVEEYPELKCNENVGAIIAPSRAHYAYSFYDDINEQYLGYLEGWKDFMDKVYIWFYQTNHASGSYQYPQNTFETLIENYRAAKKNHAVLMQNQGNWEGSSNSAFARFKDYIDSKALIDTSVNYAELYERFFRYYYGEGGKYMKRFYDEMITHLRWLEVEYPGELTGVTVFQSMHQAKYWPKGTIEQWMGYVEQAYKAIEPLKLTDAKLYKVYYDHINLESIFPRLVMCTLLSGNYAEDELSAMRTSFMADCNVLRVTHLEENGEMSGLFDGWGL